jgi:acetyl-CoA carboxylase biotin carboxyl carrier protein
MDNTKRISFFLALYNINHFKIIHNIYNMLFKIIELKHFLASIHRQKIKNVSIESSQLKLSVNTARQKSLDTSSGTSSSQSAHRSNTKERQASIEHMEHSEQVNQEQGLYFTIVSPMIGTFYRSPAPNETPFISINDSVKTNQTVCIIEAMKLMNEIESEVNGHISEILVEDGDVVDCGQALMRVKEK